MGCQEGYVHFQGHEEVFEETRPSFKPLLSTDFSQHLKQLVETSVSRLLSFHPWD